jgi:agmatine deiminase
MHTRRRFNRQLLITGVMMTGAGMLGCGGSGNAEAKPPVVPPNDVAGGSWLMPDEAEPHKRTWMAFGASRSIWGDKLLPTAQNNLGLIARTIAAFEPVTVLARQNEMDLARARCGPDVQLRATPLDDSWMRDIGPVFVKGSGGERAAVDFNFNGWGRRQTHALDQKVAATTATAAGVQRLNTTLVLEGGGIEVDGKGTAIITESCMLNDNRNPGVSKSDFETRLKALLGVQKIIWLPGIRGRDITDAHTDFYARFTRPGVVVAHLDTDPASYDHAVTQRHLEILQSATDVSGRRLEVVVLEGPTQVRPQFDSDGFAAGYINFYVCNGAVIAPQFGDARADDNARQTLRDLFPGRELVQLNIDGIAAGGGGIHCLTQQEPG